jgi:hypothetical protein
LEFKVQTSDYGADEIYEGAGAGESCALMVTQNEWIGKMFCYRIYYENNNGGVAE